MKLAFFGGIYNNSLALKAAIQDADSRGAEKIYCLGDLGAFGPNPDRVFPLLKDAEIECVQGNYDDSIGRALNDCQCGYTDPRDNHFAQISYDYTLANTSQKNRDWMRELPKEIRFEQDGIRFLLCHGSPRRVNEFLWESTTSTQFLEKLAESEVADIILGTHTGLHWERQLSNGKRFVNVGVLGRPENDGTTNVWYTLVSINEDPTTSANSKRKLNVEFIPVDYDFERLAFEMRQESLPEEFVDTVLYGWWTTCLEVLPSRERRAGKY